MTLQFRFVCATRKTVAEFQNESALGRSLGVLQNPVSSLRLYPENRLGLAAVYNQAIAEAAGESAVLVFAHDDIHLCDFYWPEHLATALEKFAIVGVAGNRRRVPRAPGWAFANEELVPDYDYLSGLVGHGDGFPPWNISHYGAAEVEVKQLDGVFIVVRSQTLQESGLRFDERFHFHYYDMDFCRQAEGLGLSMGTATVSLVHESEGAYHSDAWRAEYRKYLEKWGD